MLPECNRRGGDENRRSMDGEGQEKNQRAFADRADAACNTDRYGLGNPDGEGRNTYCRMFQDDMLRPETDCEVMYFGGFGSDWKHYKTDKALWDTGADTTAITKEVADSLGITINRWENIGSAGGNIVAGQAKVNLKLDGIVFPFIDVNIIDLSQREQEALRMGVLYSHPDVWIGMDVICNGRFSLDSTNEKTILKFEM